MGTNLREKSLGPMKYVLLIENAHLACTMANISRHDLVALVG